MPHTIRLREPWQIERLTGPLRIRYTRHFNKPTGLDGGQRVWLVIAGVVAPATVRVNEVNTKGAEEVTRSDITQLLAPRNRIEIELPQPGEDILPAGPGDVRLEIEETVGTSQS